MLKTHWWVLKRKWQCLVLFVYAAYFHFSPETGRQLSKFRCEISPLSIYITTNIEIEIDRTTVGCLLCGGHAQNQNRLAIECWAITQRAHTQAQSKTKTLVKAHHHIDAQVNPCAHINAARWKHDSIHDKPRRPWQHTHMPTTRTHSHCSNKKI